MQLSPFLIGGLLSKTVGCYSLVGSGQQNENLKGGCFLGSWNSSGPSAKATKLCGSSRNREYSTV
jgi:hypothetical protein